MTAKFVRFVVTRKWLERDPAPPRFYHIKSHSRYRHHVRLENMFKNDLTTLISRSSIDEVAEWLRRWTANPMCSARVGSNPILVVSITYIFNESSAHAKHFAEMVNIRFYKYDKRRSNFWHVFLVLFHFSFFYLGRFE